MCSACGTAGLEGEGKQHLLEILRVVAEHVEHVVLARVERIRTHAMRFGGRANLSGKIRLRCTASISSCIAILARARASCRQIRSKTHTQ